MGARMGRYETPSGCYFQPENYLKSCLFVTFYISCNYKWYVQSRCAQHTRVKVVHSIKKLVVGLSYPMPLLYSAKAALSYIAAGACSSVVYI